MTDAERLYRESQDAILHLINEENATTQVPACPEWNLRELLAHLTGALIDLSTDNVEDGPTPAWTATHLERYRDASVDDLAAIWCMAADSNEAKALYEKLGVSLLPDIVTHEYDVRGALGNTGHRDAEGLMAIYPIVSAWLDGSFRQKGLQSITLGTELAPVIVGDGMPQASLSTNVFDLSRVLTGRRSSAQVRAMEWSVDPSPWIEHLFLMGPRESDLTE